MKRYAYEFWNETCAIERIFDTQEEAVRVAKDDLAHTTKSEKNKIVYDYVIELDVPCDIETDDLYDNPTLDDNYGKETVWDYKAEMIAKEMRSLDTWDDELCGQLCYLAGLFHEYEIADSETFESVVFKAAGILNVEIQ